MRGGAAGAGKSAVWLQRARKQLAEGWRGRKGAGRAQEQRGRKGSQAAAEAL